MKTITFYSYKGGVGRTLALSNVANRLSEFGKKVCIIDFDLEAPGVHLKFDANIGLDGVKNGLVDYIFEFSNSGKVPAKIKKYVTDICFDQGNKRADISLIAAGNTLKREYWEKLSTINWKRFFYEKNNVGVEFFLNLKEQIKTQIKPDFLLIDSRTGITDISGVTMSIFADEVVLLAANNKENLEGIGQVMKTLAIPENSIQNKIPKINFVLCRIPYFFNAKDKPRENNAKNSAQNFLNKVLFDAGIENLKIEKVLVIHSDPELELQERLRIGYEQDRSINGISMIPVGMDYLELFEEITEDVISGNEREEFDEFIRVENLIQKAISNSDPYEKIKGLEAALKIHSDSTMANYHLAFTYYSIDNYDKAFIYIDKLLQLGVHPNVQILNLKGTIFLMLKQYDNAKEIFQSVVGIEPKNYKALLGLGSIYYRTKQFKKAIALQKKTLEYFPGLQPAWNNYANTLRAMGQFEQAMEIIYHALELDPQDAITTGTLAEIYAEQGNLREFYKNLDLSLSFGMSSKDFQRILEEEPIYKQFINDEKFKIILNKYQIDVDLSVLSK